MSGKQFSLDSRMDLVQVSCAVQLYQNYHSLRVLLFALLHILHRDTLAAVQL